jgi:hypothetical protein
MVPLFEQVDAGAGPGGDGASVRYSATGAAATEHGILAEANAHTREIARRNRAGIADTAREGRDQLDLDATGACCNPAAGGVANAARKDRGVADENAVVGMPSGNRAAVGDAAGKGRRIRHYNGAGAGGDRAVTADLNAAGNHAAAD